MVSNIKYWIFVKLFNFIFPPKIRKYSKSIKKDEDLYTYLLDVLQEDEKRMFISISKERYDLDIYFNRELQEYLKKEISNYGQRD